MRSGGLLWLASLVLLALPGAPLLTHAAFARFSAVSRLVLAGAAGAALTSFAMTVFALLGIPWNLPLLILSATVLAFLLRPALGPAPGASAAAPAATPPLSPSPSRAAAAAIGAVAVASAWLATAAGSASSPDLVFFWGPKAQQFALARTVDAAFLGQPLLAYMHPYYPPLVTNLYAFASMAAGRLSWTAATLVFPALLTALALALPGILRTSARADAAAATCALVVAALCYLGTEADIGGNAEMPLLLFETLSIAVLLSPASSGPAGQLLAGLLLAGAASAKLEGLPFAAGAIAVFSWLRRGRSRPAPVLLRLAGPAAASLLAWFAFGEKTRLFRGYSGEARLWDFHPEHAAAAARAIAGALASTGHGLPYVIPLLCLLAAARARRLDASAAIPLVTAAGLTAFLLFTYLDRPGDPSQWIAWSAPRVFAPVPMLFALAALRSRGEGAEAPDRAIPS